MTPEQRDRFDHLLEEIIDSLPGRYARLLDEIPVVVDDRPSPDLQAWVNLPADTILCGLHSGIPLTARSVQYTAMLPESIHLFREGIAYAAGRGASTNRLRKQIRITLLHEMGHHFGFGEEELNELGYG